MKQDIVKYIIIAGVAAGFAIVSFFVFVTMRHPYWVKKKLAVGAVLLSLTTFASTSCVKTMCYATERLKIRDTERITLPANMGTIESAIDAATDCLIAKGFKIQALDKRYLMAQKYDSDGHESEVFIRFPNDRDDGLVTAVTYDDPKNAKALELNKTILADAIQALNCEK